MKKLTAHLSERFFITASVLIAIFAITTFVVAVAMSTRASAEVLVENMDYTGDGDADVSDVVYLCRYLVEDPDLVIVNIVDPNGDGLIDVMDVHYILLYIVKIDPENPTPGHEYPTTSATTCTTTTETTVTTTTTVVDNPIVADNSVFSQMIYDNLSPTIESYYSYKGDLYESKGCYIFEHEGKNWFFSFLSEKELTDYQLIMNPENISGFHIWPARKSNVSNFKERLAQENLPKLNAELPYSLESRCHDKFGNLYDYDLCPWDKLKASDINQVLEDMLIEDDFPPAEHLIRLDYTLDSYLTDKDLALIVSYYNLGILYQNDMSELNNIGSNNYTYNIATKQLELIQ